jgi:hypothetical protein
MRLLDQPKNWAQVIRRDTGALYLATRDPRVPWYANAIAIVIAAYALSLIDLIRERRYHAVCGTLASVDFHPFRLQAPGPLTK